MAVTCKQIAEMVGVSRQAAASVLNNAPKCLVSKEKKEQILKLARELNYVHNNTARTLRKGKSGMIGILTGGMHVVRTGTTLITMDTVLRKNGYLPVMIYTRSEYEAIASGIKDLVQQNVEGIIVNGIPPCAGNPLGIIPELEKAGLHKLCPTIFTNCEHSCQLPTVKYNYETVEKQLLEIIAKRGYSRLQVLVRGGKNHTVFESGTAICRLVQQLPQLPHFESSIHTSEILSPNRFKNDLLREVRSAVDSHRPGTLYLCDTGSSALQTVLSLYQRFGKIPEDTGIIAFDHTERCSYLTPGITTADLDFDLFAEKSWELLHEVMKSPDVCKTINIPVKLSLRETFKP